MISVLSEKAVDALLSRGDILEEDRELYVYGFFMLFSKVLFFLLTMIFGVLFGIALESMLFFVAFAAIRSLAGGVHATKESTCTVYTSLSLFFSVTLIKVCMKLSLRLVPLIILITGAVVVFMLSPLDTEQKRLDAKEKRTYKRKSCCCAFAILSVAVLALRFDMYSIFYPCSVGLFLEALLLMTGKVCCNFIIAK